MKRFLSMLLCAAMLISLVPAAWAEEAGQELLAEPSVEEQVEQPAEEPYIPPVEEPTATEEPSITEPPVVEPTAEPEPTVPMYDEIQPKAVWVTFICEPADTKITVWDVEDKEITSEEDGSYQLIPGNYTYTASHDGYVPTEKVELVIESDTAHKEIRISLEAMQISDAKPSMKIFAQKTELVVGETMQLEVVCEDECIDLSAAIWSSSDESILIVDETGLVTAISEGEASIFVNCDNRSASYSLTVTEQIAVFTTEKVGTANNSSISARIADLYTKLGGKYFTTDQQPAESSDNRSLNSEVIKTQWFKDLFGITSISVTQFPDSARTYAKAKSCSGFGTFAEWYIFQNQYTDNVRTTASKKMDFNYTNISAYAQEGDLISLSGTKSTGGTAGHECIFISANSDGIYVLDSNWGNNCKVTKHTIKYSYCTEFQIARVNGSFSDVPSIPVPDAPKNFTATYKTNESATLSWSASSGATSYRVQYYSISKDSWTDDSSYTDKTATSYVMTGLKNYSSWDFRVCAVNTSGQSEWTTVHYDKNGDSQTTVSGTCGKNLT